MMASERSSAPRVFGFGDVLRSALARHGAPVWERLRAGAADLAAALRRSDLRLIGPRHFQGWLADRLRRSRHGWASRPRWTVPVLLVLASFVVGYLAFCLATLSLAGGLVVEATPSALIVEASKGEVFTTRGVFKGDKLSPADLPPELGQAVVAIEDRRFYQHGGIDLRGILRAGLRNVSGGRREGASTITQQLVRMMYLTPERTLKRKVQEAMLAIWLERQISKDEILVRYLNTAYFGAGVYGVDAAAKRYFGKPAKDLSLSEAAMLAGLVRAPSALAPTRNLDGARERAELVLDAMVETGAIPRQKADASKRQPATLRLPPDTPPGTNYFADVAGAEVKSLVGAAPGDLRVRSTLDLKLQALAEEVVSRRLATEGRAKNVSQAALVAMTPDGGVLALVGGRDYAESQFNRATQAKRQAGSLFKLFVYLAALQKGARPDSVVVDRPVQIGEWEPENYGRHFRGRMTLRSAFANSVNSVAVQLADDVGIKSVIEVARKLGVRSDLPNVPSLALGTADVNLLEMTRAFAAIAANVETVEPYFVRTIAQGEQTLFTRSAAAPQPASDPAARAAMIDLLASVVREGTAKAARIAGPSAGKTGTTQDYRDAWFIGFTPELVVGVWVGNDDNSPTKGVTGGALPAAIWHDFVTRAGPIRAPANRPGPAVAGVPPRAVELRGAAGMPADRAGLAVVPASPATTAAAPAAPPGAALRGNPRILDTGTLEIQGQVVRLFGVEGARGRPVRDFARFVADQEAVCESVASSSAYRCRVGDRDLSELVLLNGGGQASADATPDLRAVEARAQAARIGMWRRWRRGAVPMMGQGE
jgi:1A family penicillin-binding protein